MDIHDFSVRAPGSVPATVAPIVPVVITTVLPIISSILTTATVVLAVVLTSIGGRARGEGEAGEGD